VIGLSKKDEKYWGPLSNKSYWLKRSEELDKVAKMTEKEVMKKLSALYRDAFRSIEKEVNDFMMKYAVDHKLDYATVTQMLTPIDLAEYNQKIEELYAMYRDTGSEYIKIEIDRLNARAKITRLQALQDAINVELCKVTHEYQMTLEDTLIGLFTEQYKEVSELLGIMAPVINREAIKTIIEYPYAGKMFSDRIWDNKDALVKHIKQNLTAGIIRGDSIQKMSRQLKKDLNVLYYQAERLVRTETNYAMNQGHLKGYADSGVVEKYEFLAAIDSRTSKLCKNQNGKVYKLSDAVVGVNFPPLHPHCRSTVIPILEDW
jgi:SPP1 gp7 family putative phage head morphogenesis protein